MRNYIYIWERIQRHKFWYNFVHFILVLEIKGWDYNNLFPPQSSHTPILPPPRFLSYYPYVCIFLLIYLIWLKSHIVCPKLSFILLNGENTYISIVWHFGMSWWEFTIEKCLKTFWEDKIQNLKIIICKSFDKYKKFFF